MLNSMPDVALGFILGAERVNDGLGMLLGGDCVAEVVSIHVASHTCRVYCHDVDILVFLGQTFAKY